MQVRRALIIASYVSVCLSLITYDTSATSGSRSAATPSIGTYHQVQDKVVEATTGAIEVQGPTLGNYDNVPGYSTFLEPDIAAPGPLTNGATHTGAIQVGGTDTWTINGTANDRITVSVGEVSGSGFFPRIQLKDPNGVTLGDAAGTNGRDFTVRVTQTGTYSVLVSNNSPDSQVGNANYILTVTKTPGPFTISPGDEGGPLTNGTTHAGVITVGDLDPWSIPAAANDRITVSVGKVLGNGFFPLIQLQGPDGILLADVSGQNGRDFTVRVTLTGTYSVLVSNNSPDSQVGNANYILTVTKTPGPFTISPGDEGGPLTNGATHTGVITVGDLDPWSIPATANDRITVSVGEVSGSGFFPRIQLQGPDGILLADAAGTNGRDFTVRVTQTGTYSVLVSNNSPDSQVGNANYILTVTKTPGPFTISQGDEGGPLTNGTTHTGVITVGDLDPWSIPATANDRITVSVGEVSGSGFFPLIQLQGPDGILLADVSGQNGRDFTVQVPLTGTYIVLVSNNSPDSQVGNANYILTVTKTPGPFTISPGDEGGPLTNGATHTGVITVGDLDPWSIPATANDRITVSVGEVSGSGFFPRIQLQGPDGILLADAAGTNGRDFTVRVTQTGTYSVLVSNNSPDSQVGNANYILTVTKTPGPFTISPGDEGGPLTNGTTHTGVITVGDLDPWSIPATANDRITVSVGEVSGSGFFPLIQLQGPDGILLADVSGQNGRDFTVRVTLTGTYSVLVSNNSPDSQVGNANYILTVTKTPGPFSISQGDEGGPLANGAQVGVIAVGDLDPWTFQATANNSITVSLGEVFVGGDTGFFPRIQLQGPDGVLLGDNSGTNAAQISVMVPLTGTYTVLVSNNSPDSQTGAGSYSLTFNGPPQPTLSINDVTQNESNTGTSNFVFTITLSPASAQAVNVDYMTANDTATAPSDYTALPQTTLTFAPGETSKQITVAVVGDTTTEPTERFFVNLLNQGALISDNQGIGTITNDDAVPAISINDVSQNETDSGTTNFNFTVTLSNPSSQSVTVSYATADGTATAPADYATISATLLTFNAGETSKQVSVAVVGDTTNEPAETFFVNLSNPTNATIADNQGTGTIQNDDNALSTLQFSAMNYNVGEGDVSVVVTVNRSGDTSGISTVDFASSNGNASQLRDYEVANGTITFAAGQTSRTFRVLIVDDVFAEANETINVTLSNATGGTVTAPLTATVTVIDNDSAGATSPISKQFVSNLVGADEIPATPNAVKGNGGIVQLSNDELSAKVSLLFSGLTGTETGAHIHGPASAGANAPILFPLPLGNPLQNVIINPSNQQVASLRAGQQYMNVHSSSFPDGEIRGQLLWNPAEEADFFVRQAYFDFLSRVPDPGGLAFWINEITQCQSDVQCLRNKRVDVSNAFFYELEFQQTAAYVLRLYRAAYGNNQPFPNPNPNASFPNEEKKLPSYAVFVADRARVIGGANLAQKQLDLANLFVTRPEFVAKYPASLTTADQFVDAVLLTLQTDLGVNLSGQRTNLINLYNTQGGRGAVMYRLADDNVGTNPIANQPFIDAEYNRSFVLGQYFGYLRRNPDIPGFVFWLGQVNGAPLRDVTRQHAMVCSFITSGEFQFRFGPVVSRNNNECPQ